VQAHGISANEVPDYLARETRDDVGAATPRGCRPARKP
jgi:hypothetical protein